MLASLARRSEQSIPANENVPLSYFLLLEKKNSTLSHTSGSGLEAAFRGSMPMTQRGHRLYFAQYVLPGLTSGVIYCLCSIHLHKAWHKRHSALALRDVHNTNFTTQGALQWPPSFWRLPLLVSKIAKAAVSPTPLLYCTLLAGRSWFQKGHSAIRKF